MLDSNIAKTGRPAYSRRVFSGRKIELLLAENLPMMALAEHQQISYHIINNFRSSDHANELVKKSFLYFTNLLEAEGLINEGVLFIDGTQIEADANRYTFVWRKAVEKFHEKLKGQTIELYDKLITKEVVKAIAQEPKVIPGGSPKKARRRGLKKLFHQLKKTMFLE